MSDEVTADTIDDLQVRRLRVQAQSHLRTWRRRPESAARRGAVAHYQLVIGYCDVAIGGIDTKTCRVSVARERLAALHNAWRKDSSP